MSTDLVTFDQEKLELVKEMFCKNATKAEFELFISMAKRLQLDPICRQIYFIKFGNQMSIVVGIDGYRSIAERTGLYMPGREPTFSYDEKGTLISCTSYAKKWSELDKQWHEIAATAFLSEYDTGKNQWAKGKHYMLAKTAEALAIRKGFPSQLAGTNTEEEMDKAIIDVESAKTHPKQQVELLDEPLMSMVQDIELMSMIHDDIEYRNRIFDGYAKVLKKDVKSFLDIPSKNYQIIRDKIAAYNAEKVKKEMEMT